MKALAIRKHGALDQVAVLDVPPAAVARGSVRVDLRAAALNHLDLFVIAGIPGIELSMPHVLGADGAGVVSEVADGVNNVSAGDEVVLDPGLGSPDEDGYSL